MKTAAISLLLFALSTVVVFGSDHENQTVRATIGDDGIQTVSIIGGSYFFKPNHIIVKANTPVRLLIRKDAGMTPHDILIKAPEAGINVKEEMKKKEKAIEFTPTKVGKYEIYCSKKLLFFKSHKKKGMKGILEVVE